jgi:ketosteroid isomerase-like protein
MREGTGAQSTVAPVSDHEDLTEAFVAAYNRRDVEAMVALLHPEVEIYGRRGNFHGHEGFRRWLGEPYVALDTELEFTEVAEGGGIVVLEGTRRFRWREDGTHAGDEPLAAVAGVRDGLIDSLQFFSDTDLALAAAGLSRVRPG